MKADDSKNPLLRNLWCPVFISNRFLELAIPIVTLRGYDAICDELIPRL